MIYKSLYLSLLMLLTIWRIIPAQEKIDETLKRITFEEQRIEGKIRRPQLVLIKADQRPDFTPMVLQSLGVGSNILQSVNNKLITDSPFKNAFQFKGTSISNYKN